MSTKWGKKSFVLRIGRNDFWLLTDVLRKGLRSYYRMCLAFIQMLHNAMIAIAIQMESSCMIMKHYNRRLHYIA